MTPERAAEVAEAMADLYDPRLSLLLLATVPKLQPEEAYARPTLRGKALSRDALLCRDALRLLARLARTRLARIPPKPLMTQIAVAKFLGVSRSTVWRAVAAGRLRVVQVRRRKLVPRVEVDRLLALGSK